MTGDTSRRKKGLSVGFSILMIVSMMAIGGAAFAGSAVAQDATTTVSDGGDALQNEINNASEGDVIEVTDNSTYNQIIIDRSTHADNLTIRAADGASPTISYDVNDGEPTVAIDQDGITLKGFTVERTNSNNVAQAVRVAGNNVGLTGNTYEVTGSYDAAISVLTDSSGAAGNPNFNGTISDVTISGGEIITNDGSQSGVLVADSGAASFGGDGSVSISGVEFTANADSTHVLELDTDGGVVNTAAALRNNTFDTAAAPDNTNNSINGFSVDGAVSSTIQGALNDAAEDSTVEVLPGTYEESVTIDTNGLTIQSADGNAANTTVTYADDPGTPTVQIDASGVVVDSLTVERTGVSENTPTQAIYVNKDGNADNITISNTIVAGDSSNAGEENGNFGIYVDDEGGDITDGVIIYNNKVSEFSSGVQVSTGYGNNLTNVSIINNNVENNAFGIVVSDFGDNNIDPNVAIYDNHITDNDRAGIKIPGSGDKLFGVDKNDIDLERIYISQNNIINNSVEAVGNNALDATSNWWGTDEVPTVSGPVNYDPILTSPIEEIDAWSTYEIRDYGSVLEIESYGESVAIGFSAPPDATYEELLNDTVGTDGVEANVLKYDNSDQTFEGVNADDTPELGEVVVITFADDSNVNEDVIVPVDTGTDGQAAQTQIELHNGWNLVPMGTVKKDSTNELVNLNEKFAGTFPNQLDQLQRQPTQPGVNDTNVAFGAYEGTWVYADGDGQLTTGYATDQSPDDYRRTVLATNRPIA